MPRTEDKVAYTIRDVAALAKVSTATVSFVVNGTGPVSEPLRRRVVEAMEALDYHPNQVARSLRASKTHIIGMIVPQITNPFFGEVMTGVEDEARKSGYSVIFCNSNEDPELEKHHLSTLFSRRVDGAIISSSNPSLIDGHLVRRRFPLVFVDRTPPSFTGTAVVSDNFGGSREAARHLLDLGHTKIAVIDGPLDLPICAERLRGVTRALHDSGLSLPDIYLRLGALQLESGYRSGYELLKLPDPPTAIFCCNNSLTLGLMRALAELKIACPERVSVLGFDEFEWGQSFRPQLTAVAQPTYEMGRLATELLIGKVQEKDQPRLVKEETIVLPDKLLIRDSTAPPYGFRRRKLISPRPTVSSRTKAR
jgi:LacI family transcriptional regulator